MAHLEPVRVTVGVDTHKHVHVAAARDQLGRRLGTTLAPASRAGYGELLGWARGLGEVQAWGVEGTGSYGAGLLRFLTAHGQRVLEVNRPDRATRRRRGKSDPVDADAAARTVQAGEATGMRRPCVPCSGWAPKSPPSCWCALGTTLPGSTRRPRSRRCAAPPQWRPRRARPVGIA
jgi:transposase